MLSEYPCSSFVKIGAFKEIANRFAAGYIFRPGAYLIFSVI